jgi:hypothetical protein
MTSGNNKNERTLGRDEMAGGPAEDQLNSDNAFSEKGLNNADLTRKTIKRNSNQ